MTKQERIETLVDEVLSDHHNERLTEETLQHNLRAIELMAWEMGCDEYEAS